jgi:GT2 family glycosyltransferase
MDFSFDRPLICPLVSVIILNFNGKRYLTPCLSSVLKTKYTNFEVILVDNGSTDNSLALAEDAFRSDKRLRVVKISKNVGFSGGVNFGYKYTNGSYIVLLNNDTMVDPLWLSCLVEAFEKDPTIGLASSMILEISGHRIQNLGALVSDHFLYSFLIGEGLSREVEFPPTFEVSFASGAALMTRRALITKVGLLDSKIPFYFDDTLLSLKTWLAGERVVVVPSSKVCHQQGGTLVHYTPASYYYNLTAKIGLVFIISTGLRKLVIAFFLSTLTHAAYSLQLIRSRRTQLLSSYAKAAVWSVRNLKHIWQNRLLLHSISGFSTEYGVSKFMKIKIPTSFYMRKGWHIYCRNEAMKYQNTLIFGPKVCHSDSV